MKKPAAPAAWQRLLRLSARTVALVALDGLGRPRAGGRTTSGRAAHQSRHMGDTTADPETGGASESEPCSQCADADAKRRAGVCDHCGERWSWQWFDEEPRKPDPSSALGCAGCVSGPAMCDLARVNCRVKLGERHGTQRIAISAGGQPDSVSRPAASGYLWGAVNVDRLRFKPGDRVLALSNDLSGYQPATVASVSICRSDCGQLDVSYRMAGQPFNQGHDESAVRPIKGE